MKFLLKKINDAIGTHYTQSEVRAISRILATELLSIPSTTFFLKDPISLSPSEAKKIDNAIARLQKHEPIQYILGYSDFCGNRFIVTPDVLIPRPETSELVEWITAECYHSKNILDIGTGSGCIAISLAKNIKNAQIEAWDISPQALSIAQRNNTLNNSNVVFEQHDILAYLPGNKQFDTIVSNPPYIREIEKKNMEENVLLWEPHSALFVPDNDPLLFYRTIAEKAKKMLNKGGKLFFEINREYGNHTIEMLQEIGYKEIVLRKDFADNDRMIRAIKP